MGKGEPESPDVDRRRDLDRGPDRIERAAANIVEREARLRLLTDQMPAVVWSTDLELRFTSSTGAALRSLGLSSERVIGMSLRDYLHTTDDNEQHVAAHLRALQGESVAFEARWKDYSFDAYVEPLRDENGAIIGTLGIAHDVTARKRAERDRGLLQAQLRHQQKLEAIGTLASGVAHEINNPVQSIMNYAQLIRRRAGGSSEIEEYSTEILHEAQRVAAIVRNLLSFARQEGSPYAQVQVSTIVDSTLALIAAMLRKEGVHVSVNVPNDLPSVMCHPQQIQQVLMNLLTYARDALDERYPEPDDNKLITIIARELDKGEQRFVRLEVEDRGKGLPADQLERIFDPFAGSNSPNQTAGLGLAISRGIVTEHGGSLDAESELGRCTRFLLDLPAARISSAPPLR